MTLLSTAPFEVGEQPTDTVIDVRGLRRSFGSKVALDDASFSARRGTVTGFLGPNGAGKTTAIRILVGLDAADSGEALVLGRRFARLGNPAKHVGTLLDGAGFHPGRTARAHLRILTDQAGLASERVDQVLEDVDLLDAAERKVGGFSLGMRRRLGLASALLGEPDVLILDEPSNGLDPAGARWLRETLRAFADRGGTALVSSHLLAEVANIADDVVVIDRGTVIAQCPVVELTTQSIVVVRTPEPARLERALGDWARIERRNDDLLELAGVEQDAVGWAAAAEGIPILELTSRGTTLEEVFFALTEGDE